jgi:hypothetical protein
LAAIGCQYTQGSDYCEVAVSADGGKVYLRTMETRKMYVWDLTAEPELSLYTGDFELDWPTEPFKMVSAEAAVGAAYTSEAGKYSTRAVDFGGYYGYLFASNGDNIGALWYVVDDIVYNDLFSYLETEETPQSLDDAIRAAQAYYDKTSFAGKVLSTNYVLISDISQYADYVIAEKVKGEVVAFTVKIEGSTSPPHTIVLTQMADGNWEVINEGY